MEGNQIIHLGPLQLPVGWILLAVGILASVFLTERMARNNGWEKEKWSDLILISLFTLLLTYKFGDALLQIKEVFYNPELLLWSSGSQTSLVIGIILSLVVLVYKVKKQRYPILDVFLFSWIIVTITLFIYNVVILDYGKPTDILIGIHSKKDSIYLYHPINWYRAFWSGLLLIVYFINFKKWNTTNMFYLYLALGLGLLLISIFDMSIQLYGGLTIEQWGYLLFSVIGTLGIFKLDQKK